MVKITGRRTDLASVPFSLAVTRDAALQTHGSKVTRDALQTFLPPLYLIPFIFAVYLPEFGDIFILGTGRK